MSITAATMVKTSATVRAMLERVHAALPTGEVREVRMFGAVAVMLNGAMTVAVHKDASLLVRVDPARDGQLLQQPGASRAHMGTDRSMGAGWINVDTAALQDDAVLSGWLEHSHSYLTNRPAHAHTKT